MSKKEIRTEYEQGFIDGGINTCIELDRAIADDIEAGRHKSLGHLMQYLRINAKVMEQYNESHEEYGELYEKLADN